VPKAFETSIVEASPVRLEKAMPTMTTAAERAITRFEVWALLLTMGDYSRE
jgi:hypothetical protein